MLFRKLIEREKEYKLQAEKYNKLNVYGDINEIIKEKSQYETLYKEELKKNHENKIMLDTQKRSMSTLTSIKTSGYFGGGTSTPKIFALSQVSPTVTVNFGNRARPVTSGFTGPTMGL